MKKPVIDNPEVNEYIDNLIEENDELKIKLMELKKYRSLESEYKDLVSDILVACKETYEKHKVEDDEMCEFTSAVIRYIRTFSTDYRVNF